MPDDLIVAGRVCPVCGKEFFREGRHLTNWKRMKYCSRECVTQSQTLELDESKIVSLFHSGHTAVEIAAIIGCSKFPIIKILAKNNLRRPAKPREGVMTGKNNPAWKGGRRVRSDGYVVVWTEDGEQLEHRVVMARIVGRALNPDEVVHHIDGDKQNNTENNLVILSPSSHIKEHLHTMQEARYGG